MAESSSAEFEDSDVIEILPSEEYDFQRAKLRASISWILTKAYGNNIPSHVKDPFYENAKGQLQVKPQLVNLLTSSEAYCQACGNMFSDTASQWSGHWNIIQVLSRKGIRIAEAGDAVVTETVLMQTAPFKVAAHLALIDALMKAYASEIASVEHIVKAVRRYASFSASSELPGGVEEAVVFWANKTSAALAERGDLHTLQGETSQKVRIVSKTPREAQTVAQITDLMSDLGDGCCVASVIAFYQPEIFPASDVCLKECVGIADSLYNLRLIRTFCERHLVLKCFHFTYEDLLYSRENLRENVVVFLAELFFLLEAMQQGEAPKETLTEGLSHVSVRRLPSPNVPQISGATKRSFQKAADDSRHHTDRLSSSPGSLTSRQPLLQKRTSRRSQSLSSPQERDTVRRSVLAWQDDQQIKDRTNRSSALLENVSLSWDAEVSEETDIDPVSSADLAEFEVMGRPRQTGSNLANRDHPDFMEVVSVASDKTAAATTARSSATSDRHEPLMPAKLRPAKEKVNNHSKAEERGDRTPRRKAATPTKLVKGKLSPPGPAGASDSAATPRSDAVTESPRSSNSSLDDITVTPLASTELDTPRSAVTTDTSSSGVSGSAPPGHLASQPPHQPQASPGFEAFTIPPGDSRNFAAPHSPRRTVSGMGVGVAADSPAMSYVLESTVHDSQTAREAGLPIIGRSGSEFLASVETPRRLPEASREGSVGSSRSSGDFSDHESHKIHQDHKARESLKHSPRHAGDALAHHKPHISSTLVSSAPQTQPSLLANGPKPGQLITDHLPGSKDAAKRPGTTSFAEIRRMKGVGSVDNSGFVYMQTGQDPGGNAGAPPNRAKSTAAPPKPDGGGGGGGKRATFAQLPNETTWQQSAQRNAAQAAVGATTSNGEVAPPPPTSELSQLRLKLEEKRRDIERKKQRQEVQSAKMRQRLGKAAFMRVIAKQDEGGVGGVSAGAGSVWGGDLTDGGGASASPSLTHALLQERLRQLGPDAGDSSSAPSPRGARPSSLATRSPASSNSTSASESPSAAMAGAKAFSREGIQQTIDGVRKRWFHGSDPEGDVLCSREPASDDPSDTHVSALSSDMMHSCPPSVAAGVFGYSSPPPHPQGAGGLEEQRASPVPVAAPTPRLAHPQPWVDPPPAQPYPPSQPQEVSAPVHPQVRELSQSPRQTPERRASGSGSGAGSGSGGDGEDYDESLTKLNRSLTELQGEIKRLTLQQQEQFRAAQPQPHPGDAPAPPHPHPHHPGLTHPPSSHPAAPPPPSSQQAQAARQQFPPHHDPHHQPVSQPVSKSPHAGRVTALSDPSSLLASPCLVPLVHDSHPPPPDASPVPERSPAPGSSAQPGSASLAAPPLQESDAASLEDDSSSGNGFFVSLAQDTPRRPKPRLARDRRDDSESTPPEPARVPPLHGGALLVGDAREESSLSGSHHSLHSGSDDSSSGVAFVTPEMERGRERDVEMRRKKERLMQQQQRRKEQQEIKRQEKETEMLRKQEKKVMKEEEAARKKAEERARKEAIFQQYMQKKADQDDATPPGPTPAVARRDRSAHSQPRPKSMFVKSRPPPTDLDMRAPRTGGASHSSQEDLSLHASPPGSTAPLSPFRLKPNSRGKIRKAVSCNQLTQNGSQGATTYRRPPSPGTKLFVKPSAKSNRHIIINALSYCCLAGCVNNDLKNKVLEEIARSTAKHFLILFRDHGCQYRGLYSFDPEAEEAFKLLGVGPRQLSSSMVERFYKYNSGGKSFTEVTSTKHLSVSIDAVVLMGSFWKTKVTPAARR